MQTVDLTMTKGDTLTKTITFYNSNDAVIDISGWRMFFTVKKAEYLTSDDDSEAEISINELIGDGTSGIWTLTITHAMTTTTKDVLPGTYKYDLQIVNGTTVTTVMMGDFEITQDVTKEIA
jgi:hypothetical protein